MARRILTVDDSKTMRDRVAFTLKGARFDVLEAEDGVGSSKLHAIPRKCRPFRRLSRKKPISLPLLPSKHAPRLNRSGKFSSSST